jgi:hypothetical protein
MPRCLLMLVVGCLILASTPTVALTSIPPSPLSERVAIASHIFVGEITSVHFIDSAGRYVTPEQAARQKFRFIGEPTVQTKIRIHETLSSRSGAMPREIIFRESSAGAIYFQPDERLKSLRNWLASERSQIGKRHIFLSRVVRRKGRETFYEPIDPQYYRELVSKKTEILDAVFSRATSPQGNSGRLLN